MVFSKQVPQFPEGAVNMDVRQSEGKTDEFDVETNYKGAVIADTVLRAHFDEVVS